LMQQDIPRALALADETALPVLSDYIHWYAARLSDAGRRQVAQRLAEAQGGELERLVALYELGLRGMRGLEQPEAWAVVGPALYDSDDERIRQSARSVGAAFADRELFRRMRVVLADETAAERSRRQALTILERDTAAENLPLFLELLDHEALRPQTLPLL